MTLEYIAYPFLFAAIYFEAFLLVTFLSAPAKAARTRVPSLKTPAVAMIVPCYNEEKTVEGTVQSLLALQYPKDLLRIVLVDDGSTDATPSVLARFSHESQVTIVTQSNGGKHAALNAGIAEANDAEIVGCLDADSFVEPIALKEMLGCFEDPNVAATTAAMSVHKPRSLLEHMQNGEYILGIALRHILATVNGIHVTPGPFSLYRREVITNLGGFRNGYNTEDMEMALRIQRAGYAIDSAPKARVFTKTPHSVPALVKQRTRWTSGFLRNMLYDYRDLVGNPRYGALGTIVLPLGFLAILGGITMTFLVIYQIAKTSVDAYLRISEVPLSYTLSSILPSLSSIEWFYFPLTLFVLLALIAGVGSVLFILVGKKISQTPGSIGVGLLGYMLVYGLLAPVWLIRSVTDVALGTVRTWR